MDDQNNNQNDDKILNQVQDDSENVISSDSEKSPDSLDESPTSVGDPSAAPQDDSGANQDDSSVISDDTEKSPESEEISRNEAPRDDNGEAVPADASSEDAAPSKAEIADEEAAQATEEDGASEGEAVSEPVEPEIEEEKDPNVKWYVVHTYSGHENKVATALKQRVEAEHLENKILDVLVPTQEKIEIRSGKKASVKEKIFPGYILVKMNLDDTSWLAVRTTQGVTSFVGIGNKPTPIPEAEVRTIVRFMSEGAAPTFKDVYMVDDTVKIVDGPFSEFIGKVDTVDKEHGKVRVLVSIFGRETPVELDFLQVQKL